MLWQAGINRVLCSNSSREEKVSKIIFLYALLTYVDTFPKICTVQNTNSQVKMPHLTEYKKILRFHLVVIADIYAYICHQL